MTNYFALYGTYQSNCPWDNT